MSKTGGAKTGDVVSRRVPNGGRRQLIIDAAVELFSTRPYEDVYADNICELAGVASHGLISYHFDGKHGLYMEALRHIARDFVEYQRPTPDEVTVEQRISGLMRRHFEWVEAHPERFLALARASRSDPDVYTLVVTGRQDAMAEILEVLELPDPSPRLRAALRGWSGYVHEVTLHWLRHRDDLTADEVARMCLGALVQNLADDGDTRDAIAEGLRRLESQRASALVPYRLSSSSGLRPSADTA
jgi:AcrR family transcriptional regulator